MAIYEDRIPIKPDAHQGAIMLTIPDALVGMRQVEPGVDINVFTLAKTWRNGAGIAAFRGEADRRIEEAFPDSEQQAANREVTGFILQYGADSSKWPQEAKARQIELDQKWKYIEEINRRAAKAPAKLTGNPHSDRNWPPRPAVKQSSNLLAMPLVAMSVFTGTNEDWVDSIKFVVDDGSGVETDYPQLDLNGISFLMEVRRDPPDIEVVLRASTDDGTLMIGAPPEYGYLIINIPQAMMKDLRPGGYVADIIGRDGTHVRRTIVVTLQVTYGVSRP